MTSIRTITVTGGFSSALTLDVVDRQKLLTGAGFRVALVPVGAEDPPPVDSPTWAEGTAELTAGTAAVSVPVEGNTAVGLYNVAVDVVAGGRHEIVWVTGRRDARVLVEIA